MQGGGGGLACHDNFDKQAVSNEGFGDLGKTGN